jgi:hypothetical protein
MQDARIASDWAEILKGAEQDVDAQAEARHAELLKEYEASSLALYRARLSLFRVRRKVAEIQAVAA